MTLSLFALLGAVSAASAAEGPWSFSPTLVVAPAIYPDPQYTQQPARLGFDARIGRRLSKRFVLGAETGVWWSTARMFFAYAADAGYFPPFEVFQWHVPLFATAQLEGTVVAAHPYLTFVAGDFVTVHDAPSLDAIVEHSAAFGAGVGVHGSTKPTLMLEARWLRTLSNPDPLAVYLLRSVDANSVSDYLMISAGMHFH